MDSTKYICMDVHKESISIAVMNGAGKIVMECVIETKASMILQFINGLRGVYVPEDWLPATLENFPGFPLVEAKKFGFRAKEAPGEVKAAYLQKRAPLRKRGDQSGFHYEGPW
jgi:hypothetical protein